MLKSHLLLFSVQLFCKHKNASVRTTPLNSRLNFFVYLFIIMSLFSVSKQGNEGAAFPRNKILCVLVSHETGGVITCDVV